MWCCGQSVKLGLRRSGFRFLLSHGNSEGDGSGQAHSLSISGKIRERLHGHGSNTDAGTGIPLSYLVAQTMRNVDVNLTPLVLLCYGKYVGCATCVIRLAF